MPVAKQENRNPKKSSRKVMEQLSPDTHRRRWIEKNYGIYMKYKALAGPARVGSSIMNQTRAQNLGRAIPFVDLRRERSARKGERPMLGRRGRGGQSGNP